jgi:hypothetical protein
MKPRQTFGPLIVATAVAVLAALGMFQQWPHTTALRTEIDYAKVEVAELARLQSENQRLREKQIPATELATLRADHAALPRLRAELETLNKRAGAAQR